MADDIRIDSHKLIYHPESVCRWMKGDDIYPIYIEVSPSGLCNHRCTFCALDFMGYNPVFIDKDLLIKRFSEMFKAGVKSIMFAGEGEPLLNKNMTEIANETKKIGLDIAMSSNGVLLNKEVVEKCLPSFSWIRISLNAGTPRNYMEIHKTNESDFYKVFENLKYITEYKVQKKCNTTIGVQLLLIPQNFDEVTTLASKLKEVGVDYFTVKPYSQHPSSNNKIGVDYSIEKVLELEDDLNKISNKNFKVMFRHEAIKKRSEKRHYTKCWGCSFWAYIDSYLNLWSCSAHLGDNRFLLGNLEDNTFKEIWHGQKRKDFLEFINTMDVDGCREICRLDAINEYLENLKNPGSHVNFI
jgi:wyosine [tRNA(Phe)-imidazoG37] synthetase (radical SAM superfamily)